MDNKAALIRYQILLVSRIIAWSKEQLPEGVERDGIIEDAKKVIADLQQEYKEETGGVWYS